MNLAEAVGGADTASLVNIMAALPANEREEILSQFPDIRDRIGHSWRFLARPEQLAPAGDWLIWLLLAGRGFGKTKSLAGWINEMAENGQYGGELRVALIAPTNNDVRDVLVLGESGVIASAPPHFKPIYEPSKRRVIFPNGAQMHMFSAEEPERLRGPQFHAIAADEICAWSNCQDTWDMAQFCLRLGNRPQVAIATTPKPTKFLIDLVKRAADPTEKVVITRGKTDDNAQNLAPSFLSQIKRRYEGTRLGRQEIEGEILLETDAALWKREAIDDNRCRVEDAPALESYVRIVVAIDPATTATDKSDETGMVIAGLQPDGEIYVIRDISGRYKPHQWAQHAVTAYHGYKADRIVAEVNNGGDMVGETIKLTPGGEHASFKKVFATKGKYTRAEPISALYEQGRVHHIGVFDALEAQLLTFDPLAGEKSPDRMDALVWAITELTSNTVQHKFW